MVTISTDYLLLLLIKSLFLWLVLVVIYFLLGRIFKKQRLITKVKIVAFAFACLLLIASSGCFVLVASKKTLAKGIMRLKSSTSLVIMNSYLDKDSGKYVDMSSTVNDKNAISSIARQIESQDYRVLPKAGGVATLDFLEIKLFRNDENTGSIRIIGGTLVDIDCGVLAFRYHSSGANILQNVRNFFPANN